MHIIRHAELRTKAQQRAWSAVEKKLEYIWKDNEVTISVDQFYYGAGGWRAVGRIEGLSKETTDNWFPEINDDGSRPFAIKTAYRALASWENL